MINFKSITLRHFTGLGLCRKPGYFMGGGLCKESSAVPSNGLIIFIYSAAVKEGIMTIWVWGEK